jgi:hypothetical protein
MWQKLMAWFQGRHTVFAIYFACVGTALQVFHKLDVNFIMLIGAVQGLVLGHSVKEDVMDYLKAKKGQTEDVNAPVIVDDKGADERGDTK